MPNRARRKSVVDMLAKVPVHRGSLLRSLDDLLKTIELSESTVMIPTLLRDKCQFDAWELLFVAKILKASILGHSDLVEFYMNHMGNQAAIQQHQHELQRANSSSHEQLIRGKTLSNSNLTQSSSPQANGNINNNNNNNQASLLTPQSIISSPTSSVINIIPSRIDDDSITLINHNNNNILVDANISMIQVQRDNNDQQHGQLAAGPADLYQSANSSIATNETSLSWVSASTTTIAMNHDPIDGIIEQSTTPTPTNLKTTARPEDTHNDNVDDYPTYNTSSKPRAPGSCHSISERLDESSEEHEHRNSNNNNNYPTADTKNALSSLLLMPATATATIGAIPQHNSTSSPPSSGPKPPDRLNLAPTSPPTKSTNRRDQASSSSTSPNKLQPNSTTSLNPNTRQLDQLSSLLDHHQTTTTGFGSPMNNLSIPITPTLSASLNAGNLLQSSMDTPPIRNCRSTGCLSRVGSGASSPHGGTYTGGPATTNGLGQTTGVAPVAVAGTLAAALNAIGSEPVADPSSAPVKLLLQIEQLKTSINQVRNLLESVVELYKTSIDNLAVQ